MKKLISIFALLAVSLPAAAVVSLHGAAPHANTAVYGIDSMSTTAILIGALVVAFALSYRYTKAIR